MPVDLDTPLRLHLGSARTGAATVPGTSPQKGNGSRVRTPWHRLDKRPSRAPLRRSTNEAPALPPCRSLVYVGNNRLEIRCRAPRPRGFPPPVAWHRIRSEQRPEIARTRNAVPPLGPTMEDGMGDVEGGHDVFAFRDQARKHFKTLPATNRLRRVTGQGIGRFHLYLASASKPPQLEESGSSNPASARKAPAIWSAGT